MVYGKIMLMTKNGKTREFSSVAKAKDYAKKHGMRSPLIVRKTKGGFARY